MAFVVTAWLGCLVPVPPRKDLHRLRVITRAASLHQREAARGRLNVVPGQPIGAAQEAEAPIGEADRPY
jgi:hypothetical protein